jgi:hypothetical protein
MNGWEGVSVFGMGSGSVLVFDEAVQFGGNSAFGGGG